MQYSFKIKADKVDSLRTTNFLPAEIDWLLNEAIQNFVDNKYKDFEVIQDLTDQLSTLTIKSPTIIQPGVNTTYLGGGVYEMKFSDLAFPYLHLIRLNALATKPGCSQKNIRGNEVTHDVLNKILLSPFEGPNFEWSILPYVFGKDSVINNTNEAPNTSIYFYTNDEFSVDLVYPEYEKRPIQVFFGGYNSLDGQYTIADAPVNCDLPVAYHRRIVNIAVADASNYLNKPDFNIKEQKVSTE